jgi:hypothetical protein
MIEKQQPSFCASQPWLPNTFPAFILGNIFNFNKHWALRLN